MMASKRARLAVRAATSCFLLLLLLLLVQIYQYRPRWPRLSGAYRPTPAPQQPDLADVDWSRFAYTQYVTNDEYLCNSVIIFESLHRLGSKADRVMMYPSHMTDPEARQGKTRSARLLIKARDEYGVHLVPISVQHKSSADNTWADSYTKLLAFNQTQYSRVLSLDSDGIVLQPMDDLFLLPPCPVAMPRAYWLLPDTKVLSSQLVLIQPSAVEFERVLKKIEGAGARDYDMELVNDLYKDSALVLPHRPYNMLTGEFRHDEHANYLGSDSEEWDPAAVYNEAKYVHFSDWPVPKPWNPMSDRMRDEMQPKCHTKDGAEDCVGRVIWNGFYTDFAKQREVVCGGSA